SPLKLSRQEFDRSLHFNVTSDYHLIQLCAPHMREAGQGNIINITSGAARYIQHNLSRYAATQDDLTHLGKMLGHDFAPVISINTTSGAARYIQRNFSRYAAAKAALTHLGKMLAQDFAPVIRINAIAPGPIMTDALAGVMTDEIRQVMESNTALGCLGEVEDIAAAALYLASPASRWVTGKVIEVDGGAESSVFPT